MFLRNIGIDIALRAQYFYLKPKKYLKYRVRIIMPELKYSSNHTDYYTRPCLHCCGSQSINQPIIHV
jgi:hypothetical protein